MMKILVMVDHATGISGPHRNVVGSLNALAARSDVDVRLLTGKIDKNEPYASGCEIQLGFEPHNVGKMISNQALARKAVKGRELIYVPTGLKSFLYAFSAKGNRPLIVGPNMTPLPIPGRDDHPGKLEAEHMADLWIEASYYRQTHIERVTDLKIPVIQHAIDIEKFNPKHRDESIWDEYGVPKDSIKVLYVGHDNTLRKGVEALIKTLEIVNAEHPEVVEKMAFIFAGKLSETNLNKINSLKNTFPLGFLYPDRLPTVMASADISVCPSSWENFPFSVMEAMSSGRPIIAGRVGGITEQLGEGDEATGILLELGKLGKHTPDASKLMADAIVELAADPDKQKRLGKLARERVLEHFVEERLGQDLVDLFTPYLKKV